jgi:hypothetical protein
VLVVFLRQSITQRQKSEGNGAGELEDYGVIAGATLIDKASGWHCVSKLVFYRCKVVFRRLFMNVQNARVKSGFIDLAMHTGWTHGQRGLEIQSRIARQSFDG